MKSSAKMRQAASLLFAFLSVALVNGQLVTVAEGLSGQCAAPTITSIVVLEPAYYSQTFETASQILNFYGNETVSITEAPTTIISSAFIITTVVQTGGAAGSLSSSMTSSSTTTYSTGAAVYIITTTNAQGQEVTITTPLPTLTLGEGIPAGTSVMNIPTQSPVLLGIDLGQAAKIKRQAAAATASSTAVAASFAQGADGETGNNCGFATRYTLEDGMLLSGNDSVGKTLDALYALLSPTDQLTDVNITFYFTNGLLGWNSPDEGQASFYQCDDGLYAAFQNTFPPSTNCQAATIGGIAAAACPVDYTNPSMTAGFTSIATSSVQTTPTPAPPTTSTSTEALSSPNTVIEGTTTLTFSSTVVVGGVSSLPSPSTITTSTSSAIQVIGGTASVISSSTVSVGVAMTSPLPSVTTFSTFSSTVIGVSLPPSVATIISSTSTTVIGNTNNVISSSTVAAEGTSTFFPSSPITTSASGAAPTSTNSAVPSSLAASSNSRASTSAFVGSSQATPFATGSTSSSVGEDVTGGRSTSSTFGGGAASGGTTIATTFQSPPPTTPTISSTISSNSAVASQDPSVGCPGSSFSYYTQGNNTYEIECGYNINGENAAGPVGFAPGNIDNARDCIHACSMTSTNTLSSPCVGALYIAAAAGPSGCYLYASVSGNNPTNGYIAARLIYSGYPAIADEPSSTAASVSSTIAFSVSSNSLSSSAASSLSGSAASITSSIPSLSQISSLSSTSFSTITPGPSSGISMSGAYSGTSSAGISGNSGPGNSSSSFSSSAASFSSSSSSSSLSNSSSSSTSSLSSSLSPSPSSSLSSSSSLNSSSSSSSSSSLRSSSSSFSSSSSTGYPNPTQAVSTTLAAGATSVLCTGQSLSTPSTEPPNLGSFNYNKAQVGTGIYEIECYARFPSGSQLTDVAYASFEQCIRAVDAANAAAMTAGNPNVYSYATFQPSGVGSGVCYGGTASPGLGAAIYDAGSFTGRLLSNASFPNYPLMSDQMYLLPNSTLYNLGLRGPQYNYAEIYPQFQDYSYTKGGYGPYESYAGQAPIPTNPVPTNLTAICAISASGSYWYSTNFPSGPQTPDDCMRICHYINQGCGTGANANGGGCRLFTWDGLSQTCTATAETSYTLTAGAHLTGAKYLAYGGDANEFQDRPSGYGFKAKREASRQGVNGKRSGPGDEIEAGVAVRLSG